jgi:hypothetical protein
MTAPQIYGQKQLPQRCNVRKRYSHFARDLKPVAAIVTRSHVAQLQIASRSVDDDSACKFEWLA